MIAVEPEIVTVEGVGSCDVLLLPFDIFRASALAIQSPGKTVANALACISAIEVDTQLLQVRYEGETHNITADQAMGLQAMIDADGDWVSWSGLGITNPSRAKNSLPGPIKNLIESSSGKGYRFKRIE